MMLRVTAPRVLVGLAILLGLLSICLAKAIRIEKLHERAIVASSFSHAPASTVSSADRLALVIGNSNYPDADVPVSQMTSDAGALANILHKDGFLVDLIEDASHADIARAIDRLKMRVGPNSIVLVYFGGYGVKSGGQNYMIPLYAKIWDERDVVAMA